MQAERTPADTNFMQGCAQPWQQFSSGPGFMPPPMQFLPPAQYIVLNPQPETGKKSVKKSKDEKNPKTLELANPESLQVYAVSCACVYVCALN